ncbi:NmrA family NAD(P)-binding protein [Streptomyces sp. NPDC088116]|uniref:NmrA family NAD(P)-binding protein n=1 Tax=Streptomyces sp. NPDC088116 TaxID=3365825 RepID=UPI0038056B14
MTDHKATVLVTGATGNTGSRVAARLAALGHTVKAATRHRAETATRHPATAQDDGLRDSAQDDGLRDSAQNAVRPVRFDWDDPATFDGALRGTDRIYLVPPIGATDPAAVMLPFLARARATGVRRVVLLSSSAIPAGGPAVGQVHEALAGMPGEWAVLRPSWFMQNFTGPRQHADTIRRDDVIMTATDEGRVGFIDADDIAAVAVHALTDETAPNTDLVITGPQALSYAEVAATVGHVTGRPVRHRPLTYEQMRDRLAVGIPAEFAALLAGLDRAIAEGAEDRVTPTVEEVTGRPPRSFADFAAAHAADWTPHPPSEAGGALGGAL